MMNQKKQLFRIISGGTIFIIALVAGFDNPILNLALYLAAYVIVGGDVVLSDRRTVPELCCR